MSVTNFTINGATYVFTLEVNQDNQLTSFTATKNQTPYSCKIQVTSELNSEEQDCCGTSGCTGGGCGGN
jgi:hypothetical protein